MPNLQLQLLGHFQLLINGAPVLIPQARLQSLLAYLLLHRHAAQARQHLAFLFWPDSTEAQARGNLRKALYDLRRLIPDLEYYLKVEDLEQKAVTIHLDVTAFEEQVAQVTEAGQPATIQAALERAALLYTGDFLPACYDDWVLSERERLRQYYLHLLEQLVYLLEERREYTTAALQAQRLLQADPLRESTYRALMRLHLQNGDRARALRVFHTCATLLQQELGVEPSAETQAAYRGLLHLEAMPTTAPVVKSKLPLVGRRQEWSALLNGWHAAFQGQSHFALITGEAGIGKTRLAEELLQWAGQQGYSTAKTRSYAAEGQLAYTPVAEWLRADSVRVHLARLEPVWLSEIARLLPELLAERPDLTPSQPLTDSWQRQRFREALARALVVGKQPLMLLIDDLQWCDRETLEWLHYLLRFAATAQLLIVGTVRSEEIGPEHPLPALLMNLRRDAKVIELELGPLDGAETAALAALIAGQELNTDLSASLFVETEGHPLYVVETMRARESGILASLATPLRDLPPKVQAIIGSRLLQLTPATRELAGVAAVVGRAFSVAVLAHAGSIEDEALALALDELWQRRIIREHGESAYDFSHDRIREAAYAGISPPRRRLLHRRVAQALEHVHAAELDSVSAQIAVHYESAGLLEQAVEYYQRAAEAAQMIYAHDEAIHYLDKELALLQQLPVTREHLRRELQLQLVLGVSLATLSNDYLRLSEVYARALELAETAGDDSERLAAVAGLHIAELDRRSLIVAYELGKRGLMLAERIGDPSGLVEAFGRLGTTSWHLGHWRESLTYIDQAIAYKEYQWDSSSQTRWPFHRGVVVRRQRAYVLWHLGYADQAQEEIAHALLLAQSVDHPYSLTAAMFWSARLHLLRHEPVHAQAIAEQGLILAQQYGFPTFVPFGLLLIGRALAQQGQYEAALARCHEALAEVKTNFDLVEDDLIYLAEIYGFSAKVEDGLRLLETVEHEIVATGLSCYSAELYRVKGELLQLQGAGIEEIEDCFLQSLAVAQQQEAKLLELRVCISLSRLWQQRGKRREALDLLTDIYTWFTEGFDTPDLKDAKALLEALS